MYRILWLSFAVLALVMFNGRAVLAADKNATHEGTVVMASDGKLTMTTDGKKHTHQIGADVKITLDGKPAKLEDLKEGYHITVTMNGKEVVKVAGQSKAK
jgi:hypothetical protein